MEGSVFVGTTVVRITSTAAAVQGVTNRQPMPRRRTIRAGSSTCSPQSRMLDQWRHSEVETQRNKHLENSFLRLCILFLQILRF